ncbi:MAG TPA: hypothetical protein VKA46_22380 [Gemmataceae bacterium]|nr:hypothetical protein [Gemmataceae bacterium]
MNDLLRPPETECPWCGRRDIAWGGEPSGPARLFVVRLLNRLARRLVGLRLWCRVCRRAFPHLHVLPRTVVGYHGCHRDFARDLVAGHVSLDDWKARQNEYDWLGEGVYFWAPGRAWQWAREHYGPDGAVVAVEVRLGRCLDLADTAFTDLLRRSYQGTLSVYESNGLTLPRNGGRDFKLRKLDRLIIDRLTKANDTPGGGYYQTVRCPFKEGDPVYEGAMFKAQSHVQVAVRDKACIASRVFLVGPEGGEDD